MPPPSETPATGETARTVVLGGETVSYTLRRARRRTIGLRIDHRGLRVGAPHHASLRDVEALLLQHREWIRKQLDESRQRHAAQLLRIVDGVQVPLFGKLLTIRLALGANRCLWNLHAAPPTLTLCLRSSACPAQLLEKVLREKARELFLARLAHFAPELGLTPPPLSLSSARTRWGSCSSRSGIRLHWRLVHFPLPVIDYVVVHELAHLREMNHGPRFWSIVAGVYPDYQQARWQLRHLATQCPYW